MCPPQSDKGRRKKKGQDGEEDKSRLDRDLKKKKKNSFSNHCVRCGPQMFFCAASASSLWADPSSPWHENVFIFRLRQAPLQFLFYFFFSRRKHKKRFHIKCRSFNMTLQWKSVPVQRRQSIAAGDLVLRLTDRVRLSAENPPSALSLLAINRYASYANDGRMLPVTKFESTFR